MPRLSVSSKTNHFKPLPHRHPSKEVQIFNYSARQKILIRFKNLIRISSSAFPWLSRRLVKLAGFVAHHWRHIPSKHQRQILAADASEWNIYYLSLKSIISGEGKKHERSQEKERNWNEIWVGKLLQAYLCRELMITAVWFVVYLKYKNFLNIYVYIYCFFDISLLITFIY